MGESNKFWRVRSVVDLLVKFEAAAPFGFRKMGVWVLLYLFSLFHVAVSFRWAVFFGKQPAAGKQLFFTPDHGLATQQYVSLEKKLMAVPTHTRFEWTLGLYRGNDLRLQAQVSSGTMKGVRHEQIEELEKINSRVIFGEIRLPVAPTRATGQGGAKERKGKLLHWAKQHNLLFVFDGGILNFEKVQPRLVSMLRPDVRSNLKGNSESEHVFALFLSFLRAFESQDAQALSLSELQEAVERTIRELEGVDHDKSRIELGEPRFCLSRYKKQRSSNDGNENKESNSLNIIVSNGVHVVATRHRGCSEIPPPMYISVGQEWESQGSMSIGGSKDVNGIGAVIFSKEPLSRRHANQWMMLDPDEMISASVVHGHLKNQKLRNPTVSNGIFIQDILLMKKCMSTACHKRKAINSARGVWGKVPSTFFVPKKLNRFSVAVVLAVCLFFVLYQYKVLKLFIVQLILWCLRKRVRRDQKSM